MKNFSGRKVLIFGIIMLFGGFLLGSLQNTYQFTSFAADGETTTYDGNKTKTEIPEQALKTAENLERAIGHSARRVKPAVVTIFTRKKIERRHPFMNDPFFRDFFSDRFQMPEQQQEVTSLGSGMIIRDNGYILTNHHVVKDADEIEVQLTNGQQAEAKIIGSDPGTDLAVIKINMKDLPTVEFANSDEVRIGEWAIAIGAPFRLESSVSVGHVSATHRAVGTQRYEDFIQTDAAINKGNSGGPLINIRGKVIGVNTMIMSEGARGYQGVGFAISSNLAHRTATDLIEHGEIRRPWLGVMIQELTSDLAEKLQRTSGVLIAEVVEGSPAEEAGLQAGDLITEIDGEPVDSPHSLQRKVLSYESGEEITVKYDREGELQTTTVTLGTVPKDSAAAQPLQQKPEASAEGITGEMGLELSEIDPETAENEHGIRPARTVLKIENVNQNSLARQHGLRSGDLIIEVDRREIEGLEEFNTYLEEQRERGENTVLLLVKHNNSFIWRLVPLPE
ncbi:MAG: Do family serine endopeptidase [bacterium]